jgi:hypothetical protein
VTRRRRTRRRVTRRKMTRRKGRRMRAMKGRLGRWFRRVWRWMVGGGGIMRVRRMRVRKRSRVRGVGDCVEVR